METTPPQLPKKKLGTLAKVGIGCGGVVAVGIIALVIFSVVLGGKIKKFADEAAKNPTRAAATAMVAVSGGNLELVAEDDENKRYTVREKANGKLKTIYMSEKTKVPEVIDGDFSAIPKETAGAKDAEKPAAEQK